MRTTLDIDAPILADLKRLGQARHMPMGRLASEMLGRALRERTAHPKKKVEFTWIDRPMNAKVDIADREAMYDAMDGEGKA